MNPAEFANIAAAERDFWWYRGMRDIMFRLLDPIVSTRPIDRVLEAGAGTGYFARCLEERYRWRVFPVDLGDEGMRFARRLGIARPLQGDIAALPFAGEVFDAVVSMDVVVHFPRGEEHRAFQEMIRVLKPGGLLVVRVSALDILRSRHSEFAMERQRFTRPRLIRAVERHGIHVTRCSYANSLLMPVALAKFRLWEPLTRQPPASGVGPVPQWLDKLLSTALAIESRWLGAGLSFPVGQSLILLGTKPAR